MILMRNKHGWLISDFFIEIDTVLVKLMVQ